ncbi:hypothetical protein [Corynebacterium comes]|uniref:Beta-N-acetylglucosaminidase n=1 Tax=Corynebacterium comes TaxID=2675218 RepID=A0A6B8VRI6_9CORY|nr:hypothetical protein [Corynebacterium comes]QGU03954.1 hypothetical protein CETAM_03370 [Corynebacterium comes]
MRLPRPARLTAASAVLLSVGLSACSAEDQPEPTAPPESTQATSPTAAPTSSATVTTGTTTPRTSATSTVTSPSSGGLPEDVAEVREIFKSVAPMSLFEEFDTCNASGLNNAWECSGRKVGQFQFFESMSKAASTTQLITELRSSRVVEDTGRKVVGWSTLGTTAVITVVDNDKGLVMQQMVSSDRVDPEERIHELGLAERPASEEPEESEEPTESGTAEN